MKENSLVYVGLGNPGDKYQWTRHNMGVLVVEAFAERTGVQFKEQKSFKSLVAKVTIEGKIVHLLLPQTYMNLSGEAVRAYMDYYQLPVAGLLVVTDDIALNYGQLRLKLMGSAGGHNGLKSIESLLGTAHYKRLRMGIGHPGMANLADYVLDRFDASEQEELKNFINRGVEVLKRLLHESITHVMNEVNTIPRQQKKPLSIQEKSSSVKEVGEQA